MEVDIELTGGSYLSASQSLGHGVSCWIFIRSDGRDLSLACVPVQVEGWVVGPKWLRGRLGCAAAGLRPKYIVFFSHI